MNIQIVTCFSILFFLSEFALMMVRHSKQRGIKIRNDKKSLAFLWFAIPLSLTIGFFTANRHQWNTINDLIAWLGLAVFMAGIIVRWLSILQLKKAFTVDIVITDDHQLKTDGMYKRIRHPSYLGLLLICAGLAISMNSLISLLVIIIPIFIAIIYRIKVEEDILLEAFGEAYANYRMKACMIFPKLF